MRSRHAVLSIPLLALLCIGAATSAARADLEADFARFYSVALGQQAIPVHDKVLIRGDGRLTLQDGVFVPCEAIDGVVTGGVFVGKGEIAFRPSQAMDRQVFRLRTQEWLHRPMDAYQGGFSRAVLRFDDATLRELGAASGGAPSYDRATAEAAWKDRNGILDGMDDLGPLSDDPFHIDMDFLEAMGAGANGRTFFVAEVETADDGWLTLVLNDNFIHEEFFGNHAPLGIREDVHPFAISSVKSDFDAQGNYIADPKKDDKLYIDTHHYRLTVTIPDTAHFTLDCGIDFTPRVPVRRVRFDLVNNVSPDSVVRWTDRGRPVDVTAVLDREGHALTFIHKRHQLLVEFPQELAAGQPASLTVTADEKTIIQLTPESYWLLNTYPWFPQLGLAGGRNSHEWLVKTKSPLVGVVSGKLVKEWEEGGYNCSSWEMKKDVQFPSLIFGRFRSEEDTYHSEVSGDDVTLRVYVIPVANLDGINYAGLKKMRPVLDEAKEILKLYESLYGPYPFDYMNIAQMAPGLGFGQAPPGLIQLTGEAFMSAATVAAMGGRGDFFHEFFAHEIAHQWWGHLVWGTSDRDQWLSESFAEYSSGLYVQQLRGQDQFQAKLKEWRQAAEQSRGTAPLADLMTLGGDQAGRHYTNLMYNKGPYVVHMLRMQLGHDKWVEGMHRFFEKHRLVNLHTEDLMAEMEQVAGYRLGFFFDQWWKGTDEPSFDFSYEVSPTENGKFLFTGTLKQTGTPFEVLMPVFFHFGSNKVSIQNRPILTGSDVFKAVLPARPQKVTLDDFNTLLADIRQ
jgi:hypothetical protein